MADEKKTVKKEDTSKAEKKTNPIKKIGNFFVKIGKGIAKFFKDLRGETKKIFWPGRHMVIKSTGIVLAAILVIGAGIWILDFAVSAAITKVEDIEITETTTTTDTTDTTDTSDTSEKAE